ncbi:hypothetical protein IE81DRAFT_10828 [Ceraceosorus guamensis]|uniref:chitin synthase n=1 Tax=Ceraceosorus guamensis TaxID=1522189 RepID=A0A316W3T6_9BASI|nr:hypothetical protein IE81DRAFT_10828 [Ceraceosorus guamensis]PWN44567.1 hypothetical protein IE81DRAFT_10828 [Ceraceosorus guamensis]
MAPQRNTTFTKSFVRPRNARNQSSGGLPVRSEAPPPLRQPTKLQRAKTLTRPERGQPQVPLINPEGVGRGATRQGSGSWTCFSRVVTFWAPPPCMRACGLKDASSQQAWREKVSLVFLALLLGGFVGFFTMGLNKVLCPAAAQTLPNQLARVGKDLSSAVGIAGWDYNITAAKLPGQAEVGYNMYTRASDAAGYDVTPLLKRTAANYPSCSGLKGKYATSDDCSPGRAGLPACPLGDLTTANLQTQQLFNTSRKVGYAWEDLADGKYPNMIVIDGFVLNMQPYINANPTSISGDAVDAAIRRGLAQDAAGGRDATRMFTVNQDLKSAIPCLKEKYLAGRIDKITPGCFVSNLFLYASLTVILGLVFIRFLMAIWFSWFMSWRMSATPDDYGTNRFNHNNMPGGAMTTVDNPGQAPWANKERPTPSKAPRLRHDDSGLTATTTAAKIGNEPYVVCLVTAYSEGEEGISNTLTSLAETEYPDSRKLLFLVCDGMVTGSGESMSTPDICVGLLESDARFGTPMPMSFISVAQGAKAHNMAMVYAGHYTRGRGHRTPMIVVIKCGTPGEASEKKPGNRGKRDGQMILMNFFQRVTYNERMTPLDFDMFRKIHTLMGVTPDYFELCMMVDADTKVYPKSMRMLVNSMMKDHMIMGACGETRISNKRSSWVTAIQVYEYFISHHMVKAFESVFGGVTCLPGCFSMYRIKARKPDQDWVPIIVKPEVTREYSQSVVHTLHQKNLLLLGEDRFLTTLLLRTFPNRKMVFVPQARCRTEVPHTFKMLLSQRRRWINSTVHNLMELVLVRDLCGTFCFSMQFVVFMDLIGTAVLPIAIALTYTLIVSYCLNAPKTFEEAIPLMLLVAVLGLPAVLILLATRKVVYVVWMGVYLVFLPVWNFILPVYSFWNFDDFSWGETRKVEGEGKDTGHGDEDGTFAAASVPLRRWEDWERSRLKRTAREEKRRREMEKQFGRGFHNDQYLGEPRPDSDSFSDHASSADPDEDQWGLHISAFDEHAPPPLAIVRHSIWVDGREVILDGSEMEKMLEQGWSDDFASGPPADKGPLAPSAVNARRSGRWSRIEAPVPSIPHRYSQYQRQPTGMPPRGPPQNGSSLDLIPPSPHGDDPYAPLVRGMSQPSSPHFGPHGTPSPNGQANYARPYPNGNPASGHSSGIEGRDSFNAQHARQRSQGSGALAPGGPLGGFRPPPRF